MIEGFPSLPGRRDRDLEVLAHAVLSDVLVEGARPQLRAATDPRARGGELYAPRYGSHGPAVRRPILRRFDLQKQIDVLWRVSERETGIALDVAAPGRGGS